MIITQKTKKIKGVSDIMFVVDKSLSMTKCIEGLKNNLLDFVKILDGLNSNIIIDWQIGICAYSTKSLDFLDLSKNAHDVINFIGSIKAARDNEFTPGAIDYSVTNAKWRDISNRVLIVFTDEKLSSGKSPLYPDGGKLLFDNLIAKIREAKIQLHFYGADCSSYKKFDACEKSFFHKVEDFSAINFSDLLRTLAKTVATSGISLQIKHNIPGMIYNLSTMKIIHK